MGISNIWTKKTQRWRVEFFIIVSLGFIALEQKNTQWWGAKLLMIVRLTNLQHHNKRTQWWGVELLVIVSLGLIALEQKKDDDEESKSLLSCTWLTCNNKSTMTRSLTIHHRGHGDVQHLNQEKTRVPKTCNIGTKKCTTWSWPSKPLALEPKKKHDDKKLSSLLSCP
jgi:hypothetical protein